MHVITQFVLSFSGITIACASVAAVLELQRSRSTNANSRRDTRHDIFAHTSTVSQHKEPSGGYAVYVYRDENWRLEADFSAPGCESVPPTIKGSFEGQVVKKESLARK